MLDNLLPFNGLHHLGFSDPFIWLTFNTERSLIIKTFVVTFEDASVPKIHKCFYVGSQLLIILSFVFYFEFVL